MSNLNFVEKGMVAYGYDFPYMAKCELNNGFYILRFKFEDHRIYRLYVPEELTANLRDIDEDDSGWFFLGQPKKLLKKYEELNARL